MKKSCLVVLSGGQDSTTCLFWAKQRYKDVHAITFDYGQRHKIEIESARKVAQMAEVKSHEVVSVPNCLISSSPLTSNNELEVYSSYEKMEKIIGGRREITFVPMRNALFLTIAANRAESIGANSIVTGVCQMDAANYDDCRKTFLIATEQYINTALGHDHRETPWVAVEAPLLFLSKADSIHLAKTIPGCMNALAYSHTCYAGEFPPCGKCHSCVLRAQGFSDAGVIDPLVDRCINHG